MLNDTKDLTQNTVKIIGEGIQNENKNLETILFTLVWLSTFGFSYFKGNFADRVRYESLVLCPFFQMIVTKLEELNLTQFAEKMLENRDKVIQFLKKNWTAADRISQWGTSQDIYYGFGKMRDSMLSSTMGI